MNSNPELPWPWTRHDIAALQACPNFTAAAGILIGVARRHPRPVLLVSGPISDGPTGTRGENLIRFRQTIAALKKENQDVFHHLPVETDESITFLKLQWLEQARADGLQSEYPFGILWELYRTLIGSDWVSGMVFIHGWENSIGARYEHSLCARLRKTTLHLKPEWNPAILI
jgi:hypothetical protein